MATQSLSHEELTRLLARAGLAADSAELHGGLCGSLCAGGVAAAESWVAEWMRTASADIGDLEDALRSLQLQSWQSLSGSELAMQPLLPDDAAALCVRVAALADWCQGFLAGLALAGIGDGAGDIADEDVAEIVADLVEISRASVADEAELVTDDDDFRFAEMVEYVRVGVQIVFEEMQAHRIDANAGAVH